MAYVLDLRQSHQYTMEVTLNDEESTVLRIGLPTEAMVQEMETMQPQLEKLARGDKESVDLIYDLIARLMSRNRNFITITADELSLEKGGKYRMDPESAIVFLTSYMDFIETIKTAKN